MSEQQLTSEAIESIAELVKRSAKTEVLTVDGERPGTYFLVGPDGRAEKNVADPAWHSETLDTPAELARFADDLNLSGSGGITYLSPGRIVVVYDRHDRRSKATCDLVKSPQLQFLEAIQGKFLSQADMVRALRINFRGCLPGDGILSLVRELKFKVGAEAEGSIQHARQSLGRSLIAEVKGADSIPEEIVLTLPIFENHRFATQVFCAVEVFAQEERFKLTPYPSELRDAMDRALADIAETMTGEKMPPVYLGKP